MPSEQQIQTKIKTFLEREGAYVVKVVQATKAGVHDLLVCYKGFFISVEVKRPCTLHTVSKLQKHNKKLVEKAGGYSIVATSIEEVEILLRKVDHELSSM